MGTQAEAYVRGVVTRGLIDIRNLNTLRTPLHTNKK